MNILTPYQQEVWKVLKQGGNIQKVMPLHARKRTRIKLVNKNNNPVKWIKQSCFSRLKKLERIVEVEGKFITNPSWHGNHKSKQQK